MGQMCS